MRWLAALALCGCGAPPAAPALANTLAQPEVVTIAKLREPGELAVHAPYVFVIAGPDFGHAIYRIEEPAGPVTKLADAPMAKGIATDGVRVWWGGEGGVWSMQIDGTLPATVALPSQLSIWSVAVAGSLVVAGGYDPLASESRVLVGPSHVVALDGGTPTVVVHGEDVLVGTDQGLTRVDIGRPAVTLAKLEGGATAIAAIGHDVYVAAYVTIEHVSDQGGEVQQLAVAGGETFSIAIDAHEVYWGAFMPEDSGGGAIYRVPRAGGARELVTRAGEPTVTIAGNYLYWTDSRQDAVRRMRIPRP